MRPHLALLFLTFVLIACGDNKDRFVITPTENASVKRLSFASMEVREVSLPAYAAASEILIDAGEGALRPLAKSIWADDPSRAITGALAGSLDVKSTATVAAEPWPLTDGADVQLAVRVDQMIARSDGTFIMTGQFALTSPTGAIRDRLQRFAITVPMEGASPASVATATGAAIDTLADEILARISR